jgi:hypothetical protein
MLACSSDGDVSSHRPKPEQHEPLKNMSGGAKTTNLVPFAVNVPSVCAGALNGDHFRHKPNVPAKHSDETQTAKAFYF